MPKLKIEMYQKKLANGCDWLEETQTEKLLEWTQDRKEEKKVSGRPTVEMGQKLQHSFWASSTKESHTSRKE